MDKKSHVYKEWTDANWTDAIADFNLSELAVLRQVMAKIAEDNTCEENFAWVDDTTDFVLIAKGVKSLETVGPVMKYDSLDQTLCIHIAELIRAVNVGRNLALEAVADRFEREREKYMKGEMGNE